MNPALRGLSHVFSAVVALRNAAYDRGLFRTHRIDVPVISVGNITAGGAGKTPVVELVLETLLPLTRQPAAVSRGYKRSTSGTLAVSGGKQILASAEEGGDEPVQIAMNIPRAAVVVDEDRVRGCREAVHRFGADAIVLDDAYQHRRCARDLNILVYDASVPPASHRLLPEGRLREPLAAANRAGFIVFTRCGSAEEARRAYQAFPLHRDIPYAALHFSPYGAVDLTSGSQVSLDVLTGMRPLAFSGIGTPASFEETLATAGASPAGHRIFVDHHRYGASDIRELNAEAGKRGAHALVTTMKDAVRLAKLAGEFSLPVYYIVLKPVFVMGEEEFRTSVRGTVAKSQ